MKRCLKTKELNEQVMRIIRDWKYHIENLNEAGEAHPELEERLQGSWKGWNHHYNYTPNSRFYQYNKVKDQIENMAFEIIKDVYSSNGELNIENRYEKYSDFLESYSFNMWADVEDSELFKQAEEQLHLSQANLNSKNNKNFEKIYSKIRKYKTLEALSKQDPPLFDWLLKHEEKELGIIFKLFGTEE